MSRLEFHRFEDDLSGKVSTRTLVYRFSTGWSKRKGSYNLKLTFLNLQFNELTVTIISFSIDN